MGLCTSHQTNCPKCKFEKVKYVYKCNGWVAELRLWWNNSARNKVIYLSCKNCIKDIPDTYRNKFEYNKHYKLRE